MSGVLDDSAQAQRIMARQYSGGAANLAMFKRALRDLCQSRYAHCVDHYNQRTEILYIESQQGKPVFVKRLKQDVFSQHKAAVIQQLMIEGGSVESIAEVESIIWVDDENLVTDLKSNAGVAFAHAQITSFDDGHVNFPSVDCRQSSCETEAVEASRASCKGSAA